MSPEVSGVCVGGRLAGATRAPEAAGVCGEVIEVIRRVAAELESVMRECKRLDRLQRDLAAEIAAHLEDEPGSSTIEIARAIRARDEDVRSVLNSDPRFQRLFTPPNRSPRVKTWILAPSTGRVVPGSGTSNEAATARTPS